MTTEQRTKIRNIAERIVSLAALNCPDEVLANEVRLLAAAELEALQAAIKLIEADAIACEQEAAKFKAKNDGINAYLMSTQAMAHRLDLKRLKP